MKRNAEPYHKEQLEQRLLEQAEAIIAARGLDALSLRELGKAAGVSRSAPYHYFADKAELLAKVGETGFARLGAAINAAVPTDSSLESHLCAGLGAYVQFALGHRDLFRLMFANVLPRKLLMPVTTSDSLAFSSEPAMQAFGGFVNRLMIAQHAGLLQGGDVLLMANTFWAAAHGVAELALGDNLKSPQTVILETSIAALIRHFAEPGAPAQFVFRAVSAPSSIPSPA